MNNTPTPRTDEAQFGTGRVSVDFARRLERELTAVTKERDGLAEALKQIQGVGLVAVDAFDELDRIGEIAAEALQSLNPDHTVAANDMIAAVKGGNHES